MEMIDHKRDVYRLEADSHSHTHLGYFFEHGHHHHAQTFTVDEKKKEELKPVTPAATSAEEAKIARERDLIMKALEAQKAAEAKPQGTGSTAVGSSGGKKEGPSAAGAAPDPKAETFTGMVSDPSQV